MTSRGRAGLLFSVQHTGIDNMIAITIVIIITDCSCPPLSTVSRLKHKSIALLLHRGADKELRDRDGMTALHLAVKASDEEETGTLASVSSLIDFGINIDAADKSGFTALHWAIYSEKTKTSGSQS